MKTTEEENSDAEGSEEAEVFILGEEGNEKEISEGEGELKEEIGVGEREISEGGGREVGHNKKDGEVEEDGKDKKREVLVEASEVRDGKRLIGVIRVGMRCRGIDWRKTGGGLMRL